MHGINRAARQDEQRPFGCGKLYDGVLHRVRIGIRPCMRHVGFAEPDFLSDKSGKYASGQRAKAPQPGRCFTPAEGREGFPQQTVVDVVGKFGLAGRDFGNEKKIGRLVSCCGAIDSLKRDREVSLMGRSEQVADEDGLSCLEGDYFRGRGGRPLFAEGGNEGVGINTGELGWVGRC